MTGKWTKVALPSRLRWRVLSWLVLVSLVPLLVMAYQGYHCARQALTETVESHLVSVARARATFVEAWLGEHEDDLRLLAENPCVLDAMTAHAGGQEGNHGAKLTALLDSFQSHSGAYDDLVIYGARWEVVASVTGRIRPRHIEVAPEARTVVETEGKVFIGTPHGHEDATVSLHIIHPIVNEKGQWVGAVFANCGFSKSLDPILQERSGLGRSGKVYIVSRDGLVITEPFAVEQSTVFGRKVDMGVIPSIESDIRYYRDCEGIQVLGTAVPLRKLGWIVVAELDTSQALGWLVILKRRAGVTAAATLLALLFAVAAISRRLTRPFKELTRVASEIREGNLDERVAPLPGAEEQDVAEAFNAMLDTLHETQQRLVQAATLASVGELTSSIVHEMRNPLSSVKMNLQALQRHVANDPEHRELAEIASGQVQRLEGMLSDLLAYGRPLELHCRPVLFRDIVEDVVAVMRERADVRNVSIQVEDSLGERLLWADREQLCRALTNLVENALHAMPEGGEVRLSAHTDPRVAHRGQIVVSDNGPGIPDGVLESAFQPFNTTKQDGTGLGLANVKKVIDLHGGSIAVRNADGGGAVFTMSLRLTD